MCFLDLYFNDRMATYNNPHWLLSHIRNSFISTDDTGLSETVMLLEDIPHQYAQFHKQTVAARIVQENQSTESNHISLTRNFEDFFCYPGLDDSDEEEIDSLSQSYEIQMDQDVGFHRQRSNTAQKLEKLEVARRKAARVKNVKCDSHVQTAEADDTSLFVRKDVQRKDCQQKVSLLTQQLETYPKLPQNKFLDYAKYDGTSQTEVPTKAYKIFLMMLPDEQQRAYPMQVCVTATAKIQEFIGLICYKCNLVYPDISLKSVKHYGLFMTEEDGEIDLDFPPLDVKEPCSKFCFTHLAIAERKPSEYQTQSSFSQSSTIRSEHRTRSLTSELGETTSQPLSASETPVSDFKMTLQQKEDLDRMLGHTSKLEAPLYRCFHVYLIHSIARVKTEVQLGISGDKIEIDPIQQKSTKFWPRQKPANHTMDSIAHCSIVERKSSKSVLRIVYCAVPLPQNLSVSGSDFVTSSPTIRMHQQQQQQQLHANIFKHYDIETDPQSAHEIVEKINNILEVRSSPVRREYLASRSSR